MRARAHEIQEIALDLIDQEKIAADATFTAIGALAFQRMIQPFGAERTIIGNQKQHRFLELAHDCTNHASFFQASNGRIVCRWSIKKKMSALFLMIAPDGSILLAGGQAGVSCNIVRR